MARASATARVNPAVWAALASRNNFAEFTFAIATKRALVCADASAPVCAASAVSQPAGSNLGAASNPLVLMRRFHLLPLLLIVTLLAWNGFAVTARGAEPAEGTTEEHHLSLYPTVLYYGIGGHPPTDPKHPETAKIGYLALTNSM